MTPKQASLKEQEGYVYHKLLDKRKKIKPKFKIHDLIKTTGLTRTFSKGDTTKWSCKKDENTEFIKATIPINKIDQLLERFREVLLQKTNLTLERNRDVMKKLNLI